MIEMKVKIWYSNIYRKEGGKIYEGQCYATW